MGVRKKVRWKANYEAYIITVMQVDFLTDLMNDRFKLSMPSSFICNAFLTKLLMDVEKKVFGNISEMMLDYYKNPK